MIYLHKQWLFDKRRCDDIIMILSVMQIILMNSYLRGIFKDVYHWWPAFIDSDAIINHEGID